MISYFLLAVFIRKKKALQVPGAKRPTVWKQQHVTRPVSRIRTSFNERA